MKSFIIALLVSLSCISIKAQSSDELIDDLIASNILLDDTDKSWLKENNSFLIDMASVAKMDQQPMNRAIIQMSIKLLSQDLLDLSDEEAKYQNEQLTTIIHGALDHHGLKDEKLLSAMSWYQMIKSELRL